MSTTAAEDPQQTAALVAAVREHLRETLARRHRELSAISPESASLVDVLSVHLKGGKLLRPLICIQGGLAVTDAPPAERSRLVALGAAIELVQAAALIHDDVIDHSPTRRGRPAVHIAAATEHRRLGLDGDPEDHGEALAIVLGDLSLSWAHRMALEAVGDPSTPTSAQALAEFDALTTEVIVGQHLDILHQVGGYASEPGPREAARAVTRWKTVPYTVLRPVRMGAVLMGASPAQLDVLSRWAVLVGTAFQLRDDLLGAIGDEERTGKSGSGDLTEGKRTLLLAHARAGADAPQRELLDRVIGRADATRSDLLAVQEILRATGAVDAVEQEIRDDARQAREILEDAPDLTPEGKRALLALGDAATDLSAL